MKSITYNKLIRDKIPEIIEQSGKKAIVETLEEAEYLRHLNMKLGEELEEYLDSGSVEELADLIEVIYGILDYKSVPLDKFENIRKNKVNERGGFKNRLLLKKVVED